MSDDVEYLFEPGTISPAVWDHVLADAGCILDNAAGFQPLTKPAPPEREVPPLPLNTYLAMLCP